MFTNADLLGTLSQVISKCPMVKLVIYDGKANDKVMASLQSAKEDLKIMTLDEVMELGKKNPHEPIKAKREDVYCCMYTSGSSE